MNYQNIYDRLIEKRKQIILNKKDCYCERHHIIPKCLGGSNNKTNLINLTAREHYIAHCLLVKIAEQKQDKNMYYKMLRAWAAMSMLTKSNYKGMHRNYMKYGSNSIFYENFRIAYLKEISQKQKKRKAYYSIIDGSKKYFYSTDIIPKDYVLFKDLPNHLKEKISETKRHSASKEPRKFYYNPLTNHCIRLSNHMPIPDGYIEGTGWTRSEETRNKIRKSIKNRKHFHSEETKQKISIAMMGNKNPNFGKHLSEETKQKISEKIKLSHKRKIIN